jgi:glutathione S-transferase
VLIALLETGARFSRVDIDVASQQQRSPAFLQLNSKGRLPALVTGSGVLTEVPALLAFLAQTFPEADLAPLQDPFGFARLQASNSDLASTVHWPRPHAARQPPDA